MSRIAPPPISYTVAREDFWIYSCQEGGWRVSRQAVAETFRLAHSDSERDARTTDWSKARQPRFHKS